MNNNTPEKSALVIGAGIAGLMAARVLSEHYDTVVVIERDSKPEQPGTRAGVSQSFHLHQVLPRGEMILERFFPGFLADLLALGAFSTPNATATMINRYGTLAFPGDGRAMTYSRALLEWAMRQRVQAIPNVRFLYHQEVIGLETSSDRTTITGVHIRERGQLEHRATLSADLVVETSGRSSRLPSWLTALGYELPEDERIKANIGYTTRNYKVPAKRGGNVAVIVVEASPATEHFTGGVLKRIENDIWTVCLASVGGYYPPTDPAEFETGLRSLPTSPVLAEMLQGAEPLSEPRGYRIPECIRHHYERMEEWPSGLLVLGDALCHFDPVYGQGMTLAAIEVETLAASLSEQQSQPQRGFERRMLQQMQEAIAPAWWRSSIEDLLWPGVTHSGPDAIQNVPLLHKYFDLCLKQSTRQLEQLQRQGDFDMLYFKYFLMNWLFIAPREVINADMLNALLASETPASKQAILADLFAGYDQPIETLLAEIVPDFSLTFEMPGGFTSDEEAAS
jgi:2-polyprenyl-6-methoxyphenol hydroxylase-like FAD-dependent oxidoreductase